MTPPITVAIVDATAAGKGRRRFTRDAIGCGVRSICGILEQNNIPCKIFLAEDVLTNGFPKKYSTLFVSGMSMDMIAIRRVIGKWRKHNTGKVVIGGPITSELEESLKTTKADLIVIGEGEFTLTELIESGYFQTRDIKLLEKISGIGYYNSQGEPIINPFRKYSTREELQNFEASTKRIIDYPLYLSAKVYVECVRGCSNFSGTRIELPDGRMCSECGYCGNDCLEDRANCPESIPPGCGFCSVPSLFGPSRSRTVDQIVTEIQNLLQLGVKRIILSAPDFLDFGRDELIIPKPLINTSKPKSNLKRIEDLLSKISSLVQVQQEKAWIEVENIKASLFSEEVAQVLAKYLPNTSFSIGCETGSEEHSNLLGRPNTPKEVFEAVKIGHKYNLRAHVYFIHSLPGQTKAYAEETAKFIHSLAPYIEKVTIYRFRPLPLSAFGDYPDPLPAIKNPISKIIADAANEVNLSKKKDLVGQVLRVIVSEPNIRDENGAMAYILSGGPMVAVENARKKIGEIVTIKVVKALSEKLVLGKLLN
ncbi:MAG: B12-binding domain-containing radical SAM protein [Asgard group archaeon]|nr:B12-binding domain-containing radical SAM protein [Asgard group archaeon]